MLRKNVNAGLIAILSRFVLALIPVAVVAGAWLALPNASSPAIPITRVIPEGEEPGAGSETDGETLPGTRETASSSAATETARRKERMRTRSGE